MSIFEGAGVAILKNWSSLLRNRLPEAQTVLLPVVRLVRQQL